MKIKRRPWFRPRLVRKREQHLILVGFCCSGKTSVLEPLANLLGIVPLDVDKQVEQIFGLPTAKIIETHGITAFRQAEFKILQTLPSTPIIISTGSGTSTRLLNLLNLLRQGTLIWLDVSFDELYRRIQFVATQEQHWPHIPFGNMPTEDQLKQTWKKRCLYYKQADIRVSNFDDATPSAVAAIIADYIRR